MLEWFTAEHITALLLGVLAVLKGLELLAKLTPTTKDDEWIARLEAVLSGVAGTAAKK